MKSEKELLQITNKAAKELIDLNGNNLTDKAIETRIMRIAGDLLRCVDNGQGYIN